LSVYGLAFVPIESGLADSAERRGKKLSSQLKE
jgi:hypothetical protein